METDFIFPIRTDLDVVVARQEARRMVTGLRFSSSELTLIATAISEVARNIVSYAGTGMPPEILLRIFEPLFTTRTQGKGTQLGLSIMFGVMKRSGDDMTVTSEPGKGTTFRRYLPRVSDAATAPDDGSEEPASSKPYRKEELRRAIREVLDEPRLGTGPPP